MLIQSLRTRVLIATTTMSATVALTACGPGDASGGGGGSAAPSTSSATTSSAPTSSSSSSTSSSNSTMSSSTTSSASHENARTVTGTHSKATIAVPQGWKAFSEDDMRKPDKIADIATAAGLSVDAIKRASLDDYMDNLLIGPRLTSGHGAQNITLGSTQIPNSEGIPDEPAARAKSAQEGVTFVKFSYANTAAGRGAAVETSSAPAGKNALTQIDFYVPGSTGNLVEVLISTADSASANSLLQGIEQSIKTH